MQIEQFCVNDKTVDAFNKGFADYHVKLPMLNSDNFAYRMIDSNNSSIKYSSICTDNGKITGITLAGKQGSTTMINAMCVVPEYRGSSAASMLMDRTASLAGSGNLELEVYDQNHRALGFYNKYGFRITDGIKYMTGTAPEREYKLNGDIQSIGLNELVALQSQISVPIVWNSRIYNILRQDIIADGWYMNGELAGFIVYTKNITVSIKQIYVLEHARKNGIGYKLLKNAVDGKQCSCIFIENNELNIFLQHLGFTDKMHMFRMQYDL